ncbi:MAG TPA: ABC transporter substrate-binding protein [Burkholderiaceae bacterium]
MIRSTFAAAALLLALAAPARADLLVGQTAGFTGGAAGSVKELSAGAKLYIDDVNRHGGVDGQQVRLVQMDDKFEPALAARNAQALIDQGVLVLFASRGTPHTQAIQPLLARAHIALVAPSTGAKLLYHPVDPYVFNVRAPYQREAENAILHLDTIGITRIALVHANDAFGADGVAGAQQGFARIGKSPTLLAAVDRDHPDYTQLAPRIAKEGIQAVMIIGSTAAVVTGTRAIRAAGSRAQVLTLSNNASEAFIRAMGDNARGTIVSQVFPSVRTLGVPVVKEAHDIAVARGVELTPSMMEGFVGAKVLVEALRRAGPAPTRAKVLAALNNLGRYDVGGMVLDYTPTNHAGLDYVDLAIIDGDGRFER